MSSRLRILCSVVAVSCGFGAATSPAATYEWDFHSGHFDNLSLVPMGSGAVNLLVPTNEGLRITVPSGHDVKAVGFSPRFTIRGDFEVIIEFTIQSRTQPKSGYGTGPSLYLSTGSTQDPAASLGRLVRPDGRDVYGLFAARTEQGQRVPAAKLFDVAAGRGSAGRLQIKRVKDQMSYAVSDDRQSPLREVASLRMSDGEITMLRIGVSQSDPQSAAVVLVHNLRIEAADLPHLSSEDRRRGQLHRPRYLPPPVPRSLRWLWQSLAALVVAGLATWWWRKRVAH